METVIAQLVDLLTCHLIEAEERDDAIRNIMAAPEENDWTDSAEQAYSVAFAAELHRHSASGDHIRDVHEQIQDMMADGFPDLADDFGSMLDYYEWMDVQLGGWTNSDDGGYDLVSLDDRCSDELHLFVVRRTDVPAILSLSEEMGLRVERPLDYMRELFQQIEQYQSR